METVYYACKYFPVEMFSGFGASCERLDPVPENFDCAEACTHPNLCGYGKAVIEEVNSRHVKALVLTDCCDVMRRVYDALYAQNKTDFLYILPVPHKTGEAEVVRFRKELEELADAWQKFSGSSFDLDKALDAWRESSINKEDYLESRPHITVTGAHGGKALIESISSRIDLPVIDDTCSGNRKLRKPGRTIETRDQFMDEYSRALLRQEKPCMRMHDRRSTEVSENTKGIVLHTIKFCDYYSFYYHDMRSITGVPILKIETDGTAQSSGQMATRIDAFAETLNAKKTNIEKKSSGLRYAAGVDSGSTSTDAVIMDGNGKILGSAVIPTGIGAAAGAEKALSEALSRAGLKREDLDAIVTTGYGRETTGLSDDSVTEITCHAKGAHFLHPSARTVIDIGGQDSKVIRIDGSGKVVNFIMNDKCAAGTGRFLEMMARALNMSLEDMSRKGLEWKKDLTISSMCTVFAESEVVSLIAQNTDVEDIIHGLNKAVAGKTSALVSRLKGEPEYIMTGGVAMNEGVVLALEDKLGSAVYVPKEAQICGAIGAALIALGI
jgi:predicted CoA-substrate-specific enzyme activase